MIKKLRLLVLIFIISIVILITAIVIIDFKFSRLEPNYFYSGCFKVWAHRGYFKENMPNSIKAFTKSFDLGAAGTELDIFYDIENKDYVVSHDYPYNLINGHLLKLEEVFKNIGSRGYFWLDFKNLKSLSRNDAKSALSKLSDLLIKYDLKGKTIVESKHPVNLSIFSKAGIYTSYWISPDEDDNFFDFWFEIYKYKIHYLFGKYSALSINYRSYGKNIEKIFSHVPIHLFTVNDKKILTELITKENVKIVLSDENYYLENSCKTMLQP